jgi:DHA1 family bicyclomycin/chloramphenicol resistance-like MFS transporter
MGLIGASQIYRRLLHHVRVEHFLGVAFSCNAASGFFLMLSVMSEYGGFPLRIVMLFACLSTVGLISPNLTALVAPFEKMAGSTSVLLGTIQYALGAAAGAAVSLRQSGTGVPVTVVMAGCGLWAAMQLPDVGADAIHWTPCP